MKKKKIQIISLLCILLFCCFVTGCGNNDENIVNEQSPVTTKNINSAR